MFFLKKMSIDHTEVSEVILTNVIQMFETEQKKLLSFIYLINSQSNRMNSNFVEFNRLL